MPEMPRQAISAPIFAVVAFFIVVILVVLAAIAGLSIFLPPRGHALNASVSQVGGSSGGLYNNMTCANSSNCITYVVQNGDTLWAIGQKFNVPWQEIAAINKIPSPYYVYVGEKLLIPLASNETSTSTTTATTISSQS